MPKEVRTDILLDEDGDFPLEDLIINGILIDTPIGESDFQHIQDNIIYNKNSLKQYPLLGFGVKSYLNSEFKLQSTYKALSDAMNYDDYKISTGVLMPPPEGVKEGFIIRTAYISRK